MKLNITARAQSSASSDFGISIDAAGNKKRGAMAFLRIAALVCVSMGATAQSVDAFTLDTVHQFGDPAYPNDGTNALAGLTALNNSTLWGVACFGGSNNTGTIYQLQELALPMPIYSVRYEFNGGTDGYCPHADLLRRNGTMYGTTEYGGSANTGTVFSLDANNTYTQLYSFGNPQDGARSYGELSYAAGLFWGTTTFGGHSQKGTVFTFDGTNETQLHKFDSGGYWPITGLRKKGGFFYGTVSQPCGYAFQVEISTQILTKIHDFDKPSEGCRSYTKLYWLGGPPPAGGFFYGTLENHGGGCGSLFKMTTAGVVTVVHHFACTQNDGDTPAGDLAYVVANGKFYGTTQFGGQFGAGTIYEFDPITLSEAILYNFTGGNDGREPRPGIRELPAGSGMMWGTTLPGGGQYMQGTIFRVRP